MAVEGVLPLARRTASDPTEDELVRWQAAWLWWVLEAPTATELGELARTAPPLVLAGLILLGADLSFDPAGAPLPRIAAIIRDSHQALADATARSGRDRRQRRYLSRLGRRHDRITSRGPGDVRDGRDERRGLDDTPAGHALELLSARHPRGSRRPLSRRGVGPRRIAGPGCIEQVRVSETSARGLETCVRGATGSRAPIRPGHAPGLPRRRARRLHA